MKQLKLVSTYHNIINNRTHAFNLIFVVTKGSYCILRQYGKYHPFINDTLTIIVYRKVHLKTAIYT